MERLTQKLEQQHFEDFGVIFCPKGWLSIGGLDNWFTSSIKFWWDEAISGHISHDTAQRIGLWAAWECLEAMPSGAVLGPTGEVIPVDLKTFTSDGWIDQKTNFHVHLNFGTLGTGHGGLLDENGFIDASMSVETAQRRYGPFAFCPILIPKASFDEFDAANSDQLRKENGHTASSNKRASVVDQIFQTIDSGVAVKRDDIKRLVAVNMKVDEWRAHWREAVTIRPELGRSGPKPKRN